MDSSMTITYYTQRNHGRDLWYPVSRDALMVCRLMGAKTLNGLAIQVLEDNNATITEVLKPR